MGAEINRGLQNLVLILMTLKIFNYLIITWFMMIIVATSLIGITSLCDIRSISIYRYCFII